MAASLRERFVEAGKQAEAAVTDAAYAAAHAQQQRLAPKLCENKKA